MCMGMKRKLIRLFGNARRTLTCPTVSYNDPKGRIPRWLRGSHTRTKDSHSTYTKSTIFCFTTKMNVGSQMSDVKSYVRFYYWLGSRVDDHSDGAFFCPFLTACGRRAFECD